MSKEKFEARPP
jgi:hypothetical protein